MPRTPATRADWQTHPLPDARKRIPLSRAFTADEMARIRLGLVPQQMEDKWFVLWEGEQLFFHRSWTGFCTYIVSFEVADDGGGGMRDALVNRDLHEYLNTDDGYDTQMISYLIDALLLGQPGEFPTKSTDEDEQTLEQWSQVGRAMMGEGSQAE